MLSHVEGLTQKDAGLKLPSNHAPSDTNVLRSSQESFRSSQPRQSSTPVDEAPLRLVISKMVLRNFKSYAGTVEIGPFHKVLPDVITSMSCRFADGGTLGWQSFTSIVGPNGSGKSNVIDSLLFVFGFKAKKMRQGKLSELIHNSTNYQNLDSCTVEVHFQEIIDLVCKQRSYERKIGKLDYLLINQVLA